MRASHVSTPNLPRQRVRNALLIGAIAGIFCIAQSLAITLANASTYNASTTTTAGSGGVVGGLLVSLIFLLVWGIIGGLASLLGAWLATRKHPYYIGYQ
ncbi:MAG: hypothetical protein E6I90_12375 [Chloroflexi bacterium]|nr:MAG: hypothetical protein E6I90_12375 [Chloroflexota bacterium]